MTAARGLRNNNPGNIRLGDKWEGLAKEQTDKDFCQFETMAYGIRALLKCLMTYRDKYHFDTVRAIITRWAPARENDTPAYIQSVCHYLGVMPDAHLGLGNKTNLINLAKAIARHECGQDALEIDAWEEGAELAGL